LGVPWERRWRARRRGVTILLLFPRRERREESATKGKARRFLNSSNVFSLPFLTSYLDSTTNQAGYFPPPSAPSTPLPRSPSRSHGVERAKPSLRGRLSHAANEAQGRFNLN
jgi:hypothetical protein